MLQKYEPWICKDTISSVVQKIRRRHRLASALSSSDPHRLHLHPRHPHQLQRYQLERMKPSSFQPESRQSRYLKFLQKLTQIVARELCLLPLRGASGQRDTLNKYFPYGVQCDSLFRVGFILSNTHLNYRQRQSKSFGEHTLYIQQNDFK